MAKKNNTQAVDTAPAQELDINEVDGEPIYHADEEEGSDDELNEGLPGRRAFWQVQPQPGGKELL